jgi:adenine-specific DNA-methyltransferase
MGMATGITQQEKHGNDATTAARPPHEDPNPLPPENAKVELTYPNKLDAREVIAPLDVEFSALEKDGDIRKRVGVNANSLVLADNIFALHGLIESGIRPNLVYLDPPYGTGMEFHSRQLQHAYKDNRAPAAYLEFMRRRLILIREAMADDGTLYLHIGHQMLFHIKAILDEVFGPSNFQNLIVRRKCSSKNFTRNRYPNINDYILFYSKSSSFKWFQPTEKPEQDWIEREYHKTDAKGRYKLVPVHAPGTRRGATGQLWRGKMPPPGKHWQYAPEKLDEFDRKGEMHWSRNGNPRRKVYLGDDKRVPLTDYWTKFRDAHHQSIKITGYPTEKNLEMLRVIVASGTEPGDVVLDPFCGSGSTLHAAHDLGRQWIGFDESFTAAETTIKRLRHGVQPMGDYVDREPKTAVIDLFSQQDRDQKTVGSQKNTWEAPDFSFLVDSELLQSEETELLRLCRI